MGLQQISQGQTKVFLLSRTPNWPKSIEKLNLSCQVWSHEGSTFLEKNVTQNGHFSRLADLTHMLWIAQCSFPCQALALVDVISSAVNIFEFISIFKCLLSTPTRGLFPTCPQLKILFTPTSVTQSVVELLACTAPCSNMGILFKTLFTFYFPVHVISSPVNIF